MSNRNRYSAFYLVILLFTSVISCGPSGSKNDGHDSINKYSLQDINLELDSLSIRNIDAFEQRAIQKLQDLRDYFEILSDSTIETEFKNQALIMAEDLFANQDNSITFKFDENNDSTSENVNTFFNSMQNGTFGMLSFEIHDISLIQNIQKLNDMEYRGAVNFRLIITTRQKNEPSRKSRMRMQCEIIAKKIQKQFGKESKLVWEVFLGNIYPIP